MNRVHLLTEQVANQIAAGEVVERPASVVKELVENALDAQSRRITVEIQAGGRSLIRVTDDGIGMSRDDALLCLERHATSKIQRAEDLNAIATMGFRGEALPSIASVSRMTLTTREHLPEIPEATQVIINGGKLIEVRAAGSPPGTTMEVRQLFFNLPGRRKFLRSEETEYAHIHQYLTLVALAYPEVAFALVKDGRPVWQLPAVQGNDSAAGRLQALAERRRALVGQDEPLLPIDFSGQLWASEASADDEAPSTAGPPPTLRLWGHMGQPGVSRSTRQDQHLFVNRRPVENRGLNYALLEGYHTALMKGRYPVCTLFLEIDPAQVDVNIHPAKREVKFRHERAVRQLVTQGVRQVLLAFHGEKPAATPSRPAAVEIEPHPGFPEPVAQTRSSGDTGHPPSGLPWKSRTDTPVERVPITGTSRPETISSRAAQFLPPGGGGLEHASVAAPREPVSVTPGSVKPAAGVAAIPGAPTERRIVETTPQQVRGEALPLLQVPLRLVGVVGRLYVVLESDRGLVLLDQHAAHERVLFEQMLNRMEQQTEAPSQRLLLPETVELSIRDAQFLKEQLPTLTRMGVGLSEFGERTFLLEGLPPFVKMADPKRFVLQLLDELKAAGQQVNTLRLGEQTIAKTVCRHAVKANDPLANPELENLIADLRQCAMPYTCPHGRPTLIEMNYRELEKKFGRIGA